MTSPDQRARIAAWIASMQGDRTGQEYAEDITATTGWKVDRSRISKYANGTIHIGRDVFAHMADYAKKKGFSSFEERAPEPPDLPTALLALTAELRAWREERELWEIRVRALEAEVQSLRGPSTAEGSRARSALRETVG